MSESAMTEISTATATPQTPMSGASTGDSIASAKLQLNPMLKLALDLGPLVLFFVANARFGIFAATGTFMVAAVGSLIASYVMIRRWPIMPVVTAIVVLVFGGLTLVLHDDTFIKVKPTVIYGLFAAVLLGGYVFDRPFLAIVLDSMFQITEEGWRKLTLRWAAFFFVMAVLNELVWRTQSTDFWVNFKLFGFVPLTFLFGALQYPLLMRYAIEEVPATAEPSTKAVEPAAPK
jgi:intracellular septation protein